MGIAVQTRPGAGPSRRLARSPWAVATVVLGGAALVFGAAVLGGLLEVRRPRPEAVAEKSRPARWVERDRVAEDLLKGVGIQWVYRYGGGLPECWVEIESEGHGEKLGPWEAVKTSGLIGPGALDRPQPESVEGYVALFGPATPEQVYTLVGAVVNLKYPDNPERPKQATLTGTRQPLRVKLPDLAPAAPADESVPREGGKTRDDEDQKRELAVGEVIELNHVTGAKTPSGKERNLRLKFRFTPESDWVPATE